MTILRATVTERDEGTFHFVVGEDPVGPYRTEFADGRPAKQYVPKMWGNTYGLHVQSVEDESVYTVYPWHAVHWYEERR